MNRMTIPAAVKPICRLTHFLQTKTNQCSQQMSRFLIVMLLATLMTVCVNAQTLKEPDVRQQPLAFPTAEGYGKYTVGGRGGQVYEVTTLADEGEGSLRAAVEAQGPRTIVFRVSGTIRLKKQLRINNPYITIAGQTAPGDGICLRDYPLSINADEVIIRFIRVRLGDVSKTESDAISARGHKNIILDHVSASWSVDETMSIYHCDSITVQWCLISESLFGSNHMKGAHGFGGIWGSNYSTYHHNLIACHSSRNPRFAGGSGYVDFRNNVIYNWGFNSIYGGGALHKNGRDPRFLIRHTDVNIVNNYFKPGPATAPGRVRHRIANPSWAHGDCGKWYVDGNVMEGSERVTANNWDDGVQPNDNTPKVMDIIHQKVPWQSMPIAQETATAAYQSVLNGAGALLPQRDAVDSRLISEVRSGIATYEGKTYKTKHKMVDKSRKSGIIDSQEEVGGWPALKSLLAPEDSDHDGMPDQWELSHGLDPHNPADGVSLCADGSYTNLELYLAALASEN